MVPLTWICPRCGQKLPLNEPSCRVCLITRIDRDVIGKIKTPERTLKPPPAPVEVRFPCVIKEARFNLPLPTGTVWSSGILLAIEQGLFLLGERDGLQTAPLIAQPPAAAGPVGPTSIFIPKANISRVIHEKLIGHFLEIQGKRKIPLRLEPSGWEDLDLLCNAFGIAHS
jgi:hypothetical protein